ncbi:MAG: phosphomannomutase/phosphoglucomutase [Candidatus Levybacteria bacterium]|nr:phosphomannomutase/phosphoglucomutase [Candidatus Levybacteria bacterium]
MLVNEKIFKAYDIRGIYPTELNEEIIFAITKAIYTFFAKKLNKKHLSIVLGYDMRLSGPPLVEQVKKALLSYDIEIIDVGLVSTPTFYFTVSHYGFDGGIQVSASHNPKEYNGMKFVMNSPSGLIKIGRTTGIDEVKEMTMLQSFFPPANNGKITKKEAVLKDEVKEAYSVVKPGEIKPLKVVADAANAMGALYLDELFSNLPCELTRLNFTLDGTFPVHQPNPLEFDTLTELRKKVVTEKADLGIAPDGDGDRVFFIDEMGEVVPASVITALVIKELLTKYPKEKVAFDIRSTWTPLKAARDYGGIPIITPVGHALITDVMHKEHALFAGESSGHYYFRATGNAESSVSVILIVLDVMSRLGKPLSEILKPFFASVESGERNFKLKDKEVIHAKLQVLKETYKDGELNELDGVSIEYPTWRCNVRSSNTEPLLRLNLEAQTKEEMEQKVKELTTLVTA